MCDTNWCTFCDCAVSSISNSIYCSEKCYKLDALALDSHCSPYIAEKSKSSNTTMMQSSHIDQRTPSCRDSISDYSSSICSEDLAAMHFDLVSPPTLLATKTPPLLSTSTTSPTSSYGDSSLSYNAFSYNLAINEKLSMTIMTRYHHA